MGHSKVRYPNSCHNVNPSLAVDAAPYPIDWLDHERFIYFGGYVKGIAAQLKIPIRWGGDWDGDFTLKDNLFNDYAHFEIHETEGAETTKENGPK
jgi:peptidoglycan L-alanyl-D-glutamate endopeptidase CwlK